ncbi:hypothetical protein EYF80_038159 [Liparis tanakae]|uniref:Uncharacterized protein n=1 Tax=Liparis tanakae TaxID=230148 RepID=A0A4Z2GFH7_9TELE|nr:hypothetical protein EYF80_038159 [Liparis tanakae]
MLSHVLPAASSAPDAFLTGVSGAARLDVVKTRGVTARNKRACISLGCTSKSLPSNDKEAR